MKTKHHDDDIDVILPFIFLHGLRIHTEANI